MTAFRLAFPCLLLTILSHAAQQPPSPDVEAMLRQANQEIRSFEKAGGKKADPNHPVEKWVQTLWALREKSPRTPETATATSEAVHLLIRADRFQEAYARVDQLALDDPAWESLGQVLFEAASSQKDFAYFFQKLDSVLPKTTDKKVRAALQLSLARGWREQKNDQKAKAAFEAAIEFGPGSSSGREAEIELYEMLHLGVGQAAPQFSVTAVNGSHVSLADYTGKPAVLLFWATH